MKNFKFSVLFLALLFTLSTVTAFAGSNSELYASWWCVESYWTSDDNFAPNEEICIYDDVNSVKGSYGDGFTTRESNFELHEGDVIEISVSSGAYLGETISEYNSADHYVDVYCGDTCIGCLFTPVYSDLNPKKDSKKIVVTKDDISPSGNNKLTIKYQIGNFYNTYTYVSSIYINGQYLNSNV